MNNEIIIKDLDNIKSDLEEIVNSIKSTTLTNSTNNLLNLLESLSKNIKNSIGEENEH